MVGELIRHPALRLLPLEFPTFPQAIVKKEKGPKRKKAAATVPLLSSKLIGESNYKGNPLSLTHLFNSNRHSFTGSDRKGLTCLKSSSTLDCALTLAAVRVEPVENRFEVRHDDAAVIATRYFDVLNLDSKIPGRFHHPARLFDGDCRIGVAVHHELRNVRDLRHAGGLAAA
jgi:hypothetical protein